jgi:hypothetical protein
LFPILKTSGAEKLSRPAHWKNADAPIFVTTGKYPLFHKEQPENADAFMFTILST